MGSTEDALRVVANYLAIKGDCLATRKLGIAANSININDGNGQNKRENKVLLKLVRLLRTRSIAHVYVTPAELMEWRKNAACVDTYYKTLEAHERQCVLWPSWHHHCPYEDDEGTPWEQRALNVQLNNLFRFFDVCVRGLKANQECQLSFSPLQYPNGMALLWFYRIRVAKQSDGQFVVTSNAKRIKKNFINAHGDMITIPLKKWAARLQRALGASSPSHIE
jgi:hypothetical protein